MGFCIERIDISRPQGSQTVQRKVPSQCMRPLVAKNLDGHLFVQFVAESDDKSLGPPDALAKGTFREPTRPDDHTLRRRTCNPDVV